MPLWKHTRTKTHTASLLAKPTPLNINLGSDRFGMFTKCGTFPARSVLVFSSKIRLAVREDVDEASRLLKEARKNASAGGEV